MNNEYAQKALQKIVKIDIPFNSQDYTKSELLVIDNLVKASKELQKIFLLQICSHSLQILKSFEEGSAIKEFFLWNMGPWDRLNDNYPFAIDITKPKGVEFYPIGMKAEEFELYIKQNPTIKEAFTSFYTIIKKDEGKLVSIPFSVEYAEYLERASKFIEEAAILSEDIVLSKFLHQRAKALLSNNYFDSELLYMDISGKIEPAIGPYEVYDDDLFGLKASFESFINIKDFEESKKLEIYAPHLQNIDNSLLINRKYKVTRKKQDSFILVANLIYAAGEAVAGYRAQAFNLPNDEGVREIKGSKKTLMKNIMSIKFYTLLMPMVDKVICDEQTKFVNFDAHFKFVLFHELSHGFGPASIINENGAITPVSVFMKEFGSSLEEAKADILGLVTADYLINKKVITNSLEEIYVTYLANIFRAIRFSMKEAHGLGMMCQYNYLRQKGGIVITADGRFKIDTIAMQKGVTDLTSEFLEIQASGDYNKAVVFFAQYGGFSKELENSISKLSDIPIDIYPVFEYDKK